jgi:hypothetical protein
MTKDLLLLFPLLVFFLAGGVCGALFVAPRLGWHRPAAAPAPVPCRWRHLEDTPDMLDVYATAWRRTRWTGPPGSTGRTPGSRSRRSATWPPWCRGSCPAR